MVKAPVLSLKHKNLTPAHAVYTAIILIANSRFLLSFLPPRTLSFTLFVISIF